MLLRLALLVSLLAARFQAEKIFYASEDAGRYFEDFIATYNKQYASEKEKYFRFNIFKGNLKKINELNSKSQATYGINEFGDMTYYESMQYYTETVKGSVGEDSVSGKRCKIIDFVEGNVPAPDSLDWREKGKVTRVKNLGKCYNNGIFSCIANLESQYAIKYNKLLEFSEQQVIDCCGVRDCGGCETYGPWDILGRKWLVNHGSLELEQDYPFQGKVMNCSADKNKTVAHVTTCYWYKVKTVEALKQLLATVGPITVYGDKPYWIMKNCWGEKWGEKGYIRLAMSEINEDNCSISEMIMNSLVV